LKKKFFEKNTYLCIDFLSSITNLILRNMKRVFSFFLVIAIFLSLGVNSCTNEDPAKPLDVNLKRTATIKVVLLIDNDETDMITKWTTPKDLRDYFYVTVDYSDLIDCEDCGKYVLPNDRITYSNGTYSFEAPVGINPTTVNIRISAFEGEVKQGPDTYVDVVWSSSEGKIEGLTPGALGYKEFQWKDDQQYTVKTKY